ncbi:hypothetical protein DFH11DRAFT_1595195 [Phellopilus nigrolimitatus]|nr:hypothetical protein DFH11DRAFT_1595195 [Phellopilus nigrolimitatus]
MTIERRIEEATFEIVKERQMEFDQNSDQEFLRELFGDDTPSLFEGPVWVYVLERRRAVEVWNALMGEEDPDRAREQSPNSLRAVYGVDLTHNALMGSPNTDIAEVQISCLFQSSPLFPPHDPDDLDEMNIVNQDLGSAVVQESWQDRENVLSPSSSQLSQSARLSSSGSRRGTSVTSSGSAKNSPSGKAPFRALVVPKTTLVPDIEPRTSRASDLRHGIALSPRSSDRVHVARTKEEQKEFFMDVPGHKRSTTIQVASTAPPTIAPRMSRAASLRLGQKDPSPSRPKTRRPSTSDGSTFDGVPGHKRRESFTVASVQAPTVAPRLNKSAELRAKKESAPPTSFMFRQPITPKTPGGLSRTPSQSSLTPSRPSSSMGRSSSSMGRPSSSMANARTGTPSGRLSSIGRSTSQNGNGAASSAPPRPPSIEPRSNRSALLRAKMGTPTGTNSSPSTPAKKVPVTRRASVAV